MRRCCLPPRLLAETLHSIQTILFHFDDQRSARILERLIAKGEVDEDCSQGEGSRFFDKWIVLTISIGASGWLLYIRMC